MNTTRESQFQWMQAAIPLLAVTVLLMGQTGFAQEEERGRVEIGVRHIFGDRQAAKFREYRDIPVGLYIQRFEVNLNSLLNERFFLDYQTRETVEKDQSHLLSTGLNGKYRLVLRWDQTPHFFTNTTKTLFTDAGNGRFTAPSPLRSSLQAAPAGLNGFLEGARPLDIGLRRNTGSGTFTYTPTANLNIDVAYSREKQSGSRPFGSTTNAFTNTIEHPEPIDYRTQQVKAGAEYANHEWGLQWGYSGSLFKNAVSELVWDNPFRTSDIAGGSSRGRIDLYPDNKAHSLNVAGAFNLPASTRFMGSVVRGWMRQNDPFVPFTVNSAIENVPQPPASSLDGRKQTLAMNYTVNNHAIQALSLTARYRSYDYDNDSRSLVFPQYVSTDGSLASTPRRNLPYAYDQRNAAFEAVWKISHGYSFKLGYEWERFGREHRDVERSIEHTAGAAFDVFHVPWFTFRASYRHGERQPEHYEPNEESFPLGEGPTALGQLHDLRKFDQAARGRDRGEALVQFDPTDRLSLSGSLGTTQDNYKASRYGLLKSIDYNVSFDATYSLHPDLAVFAEYSREQYKYDMRSRQRVPLTATAPANDTTNNDWESRIRDRIDTWGAGFDGGLLDQRVLFEAFYNLSAAKGAIRTRALGLSTLPGFLVTSASDYPNTSNRFHQVTTSIRFRMANNFYPKIEYRFEKYDRIDFQIDQMRPNMSFLDAGTGTSLFLGADVPGYKVHVLALALEYRF